MKAGPTAAAPTVLVTAVGRAEGSRAAAAALACAAAGTDPAPLLVDVGGRPPRPTLLASAAAQRLEERLVAHLPEARVAARGQLCQVSVPTGPEGLETASAAVTVARGAIAVLHLPPAGLQPLLSGPGLAPSAVLLRADIAADRALLALVVRDLRNRDLDVGVVKQPLSWVSERRALFGACPAGVALSWLPASVRHLVSHECNGGPDDQSPDPAGAAKPEWGDHAGTGPR
jgi:hypothetical protein